jgi:DNA-binding transcriptional ArsR family regulator
MNINAEKMLETAAEACELLKTMANPHRLVILCQLVGGEKSVGELADFLGIRSTTVSQNLALMRACGLVSARRDGQTMWYSIKSAEARTLLETLYRIYCSSTPLCEEAKSKPRTRAKIVAGAKPKKGY